jgi:hypothetical protein
MNYRINKRIKIMDKRAKIRKIEQQLKILYMANYL